MKKIFVCLMAVVATAGHFSCKNQLNELPTQSKVEGNVIIDQKSAEIALNGAYLTFAEGGDDRGTPSVKWALNHEILTSILGGNLRYPWGKVDFEENNRITSNAPAVQNLWTKYYTLINAANGVIEQTQALSDTKIARLRKTEIIAEARLLRAYGHYNLLRLFAQFYDINSKYGAMLRTEFVHTDNIAQSRSTVQESYSSIFSDIDFAIENAPSDKPNHYINKWVAKSLKCKVLTLRGSATDQKEILALSEDIIDNAPYKLEENTMELFSNKGISSTEVIFGVMPKPNQFTKTDAYYYRTSPGYLVTDYFKSLFDSNDPRATKIIGSETLEENAVIKYRGKVPEDCYAIRLTEIYLLRAEAITRSGLKLDDAKTILKTVLKHAGVSNFEKIDRINTSKEMILELYKETVRNFAFEDGQDWTTLCRLPLEEILKIKPSVMDKNHIILPIPAEEFRKNPKVGEQNPGYNKI
ncbi:RagB/SusD family nutrient uptake outer membrane protein [Sphingobacterium sp.]|uniref:RagB/SusD family nutrient uptake outer membrane protein n=1 Tax=Sphingobacterium sp. TaxID=341027 RepID=UPI0028A1ED65|nr:RagB/SusD family nutrient uptake outer membrane protein [Sphingobacterium sp.]